MNWRRNLIVPAAFFLSGYLGAKIASTRPASTEGPIPVSPPNEDRVPGTSKGVGTGHQSGSGFASAMAALTRVEVALNRGNFESLMRGEHGIGAALQWAEADPEGLWHWLESDDSPDPPHGGFHEALFRNWFVRDPDAAIDALRKTTGRSRRLSGVQGIVSLLFDDDPEIARAVGERLDQFASDSRPDPRDSGGVELRGGRDLVEKLRALPDSHVKRDLLRATVAGWSYFAISEWNAARDWAGTLPEEERAEMERALFAFGLPRSVRGDPDALAWVAEWLAQDENRDMRTRIGGELASAMAKDDAVNALAWAGDNLSGAGLARAVAAVVSSQLRDDREAAFEIVDALPPGGVRLQAGRALIHSLQQSDSLAAYERALNDERDGFEIDRQLWRQVATILANKRPDEGRRILADPPEDLSPAFEHWLLNSLALRHPETTLEWAVELRSERGDRFKEQVLRSWRALDPVAAEKWGRDAGAP